MMQEDQNDPKLNIDIANRSSNKICYRGVLDVYSINESRDFSLEMRKSGIIESMLQTSDTERK